MNERQSEPTEIDDATNDEVVRIMDTRGISRSDAERIMAVREDADLRFTREESREQHPSTGTPRRRPSLSRGRLAVSYDSEDIYTGILSDEQVRTNTLGIAGVRAVMHATDQELTPHERAIARAKAERKSRSN